MSTYTTLKATQVSAAKPREKDYVLSDGGGLQLRVRKIGVEPPLECSHVLTARLFFPTSDQG